MIEIHRHDAISEIRLAHPPVNALDPALVAALRHALSEQVARDARAIVLSGSPGIFSAGLDLPALLQLDREELHAFWSSLFGLLEDLAACPVPVAAALTGHSPAGGTVVALFCDYRVMARGEFGVGLNEVQVGLIVPGVIHEALARLVGRYRAERHLLAGSLLTPQSALELGLVDELVDPGYVPEGACDWCRSLLELPEHAVRQTRRALRRDLVELFAQPGNIDVDAFCDHWFRDETQGTLRQVVQRFSKHE